MDYNPLDLHLFPWLICFLNGSLYLLQNIFLYKEEILFLLNKTISEFVTTKSVLQEMIEGFLQVKKLNAQQKQKSI